MKREGIYERGVSRNTRATMRAMRAHAGTVLE